LNRHHTSLRAINCNATTIDGKKCVNNRCVLWLKNEIEENLFQCEDPQEEQEYLEAYANADVLQTFKASVEGDCIVVECNACITDDDTDSYKKKVISKHLMSDKNNNRRKDKKCR